jgi:hypothetical protein
MQSLIRKNNHHQQTCTSISGVSFLETC